MKALTARQLIRIFEANDFRLSRQRGSHMIYKHMTTGRMVPIPLHGRNKPIPIGTFMAIVKQSGIDPKKFRKEAA